MTPVLVQIAVLMTLQAPPVAADPGVAGSKEQRVQRAKDSYARALFVAASLEFEALHRDYPEEPRFLYNAGTTRYAAGHYAQALVHFNAYAARGDISEADRKDARAQQGEARNRVASVHWTIRTPVRGPIRVSVRRTVRGVPDLRSSLDFTATATADGAALVVQLEPGTWSLSARSDDGKPVDRGFEVRGLAAQSFSLDLPAPNIPARARPIAAPPPTVPREDPTPPPQDRHPARVAVPVAGGVTAVTGAALLAVGLARRDRLASCPGDDVRPCKTDLARAIGLRDAGAGLLGAGAGLLVGGLTWKIHDPAARKRAWVVEGVVGGLAVGGGLIGVALGVRTYNAAHAGVTDDWQPYFSGPGRAPLLTASAAILGLGVGLFTGSIVGLTSQRRLPAARAHALRLGAGASPWFSGLTLSGRF